MLWIELEAGKDLYWAFLVVLIFYVSLIVSSMVFYALLIGFGEQVLLSIPFLPLPYLILPSFNSPILLHLHRLSNLGDLPLYKETNFIL